MLNPVLTRPSNLSQVSSFCLRPLSNQHNKAVTKHKSGSNVMNADASVHSFKFMPCVFLVTESCAASRKVAGSSPDEVDFLHLPNPSGRTMVLGSTEPLTEMRTRNL
jgi:hypothetical protein